jgi:pimeloyl-ACP methyl ester carboxylesterase
MMRRVALLLLLLAACRRETPTVVFESGLGDTRAPWTKVAVKVGERARVFTYDRTGKTRRTAKNIARELRETLRNADIEPPYVLVSHSAGAWYALQFAADHPDEVAALIMVDPTPFRFFSEGLRAMSPAAREQLERQQRNYIAHASKTRLAEWNALATAAEEASRAKTRRDLPVTIITGGRIEPSIRAYWIAQHEAWAKQWPRGRHVVVDSGHYVQLEKPDAVVDEIVARLP